MINGLHFIIVSKYVLMYVHRNAQTSLSGV